MSNKPIDLYHNELMKIKIMLQNPTEYDPNAVYTHKPELIGYTGIDTWDTDEIFAKVAGVFSKWDKDFEGSGWDESEDWHTAIKDTASIYTNIKNKHFKMHAHLDPYSNRPHTVDVKVVKFNYDTKISEQDSEALMNL